MITDNVTKFLALAPLIMPKLIGDASPDETEITDDSAVLYFAFKEAQPLSWVMDVMEDEMEMTLLYHGINKRDEHLHHCCFFSSPQSGRNMFKINIVSDNLENANGLTVSIYESLDVMESELESDLQAHTYTYDFVQAMSTADLLSLFCTLS